MTEQSKSGGGAKSLLTKQWWESAKVESDPVPMVDLGTGKPFVIRQFEFSFNPETLRKIWDKQIPPPTQQDLFNSNWPQIRIILWKDGLVAVQEKEFPPRLVIGKKKYKIFILCEPRLGTMVNEKPRTLQDIASA